MAKCVCQGVLPFPVRPTSPAGISSICSLGTVSDNVALRRMHTKGAVNMVWRHGAPSTTRQRAREPKTRLTNLPLGRDTATT